MKQHFGIKVNIAYIDTTNLDKALRYDLGWKLDYRSFRVWLSMKYAVERAYIFIGFIPKYKNIYDHLRRCGFSIVFREVVYQDGRAKGNCDSDLLIHAARDLYEDRLDKAVVVASDGDYAPLMKLLQEKNGLRTIVSPGRAGKCSVLLKKTGAPIAYANDYRSKLELKNAGS